MLHEVMDRLQRFQLRGEEKAGMTLELEDTFISREECRKSLLGKIFGDKAANFSGLRNTVPRMWSSACQIKVREIGFNLFQFVFETQEASRKILNGKAWTFDGQFLLLKPWGEEVEPAQEKFEKVQLWVQVWNLPYHWLSKEVGRKFKFIFGNVEDILIPESGSISGRHLKVLAEINLNQPLLRGTMVKCENEVVWVEFRYENLASFCYYCGRVGHSEKLCGERKCDAREGKIREGQYGEWLRASAGRLTTRK